MVSNIYIYIKKNVYTCLPLLGELIPFDPSICFFRWIGFNHRVHCSVLFFLLDSRYWPAAKKDFCCHTQACGHVFCRAGTAPWALEMMCVRNWEGDKTWPFQWWRPPTIGIKRLLWISLLFFVLLVALFTVSILDFYHRWLCFKRATMLIEYFSNWTKLAAMRSPADLLLTLIRLSEQKGMGVLTGDMSKYNDDKRAFASRPDRAWKTLTTDQKLGAGRLVVDIIGPALVSDQYVVDRFDGRSTEQFLFDAGKLQQWQHVGDLVLPDTLRFSNDKPMEDWIEKPLTSSHENTISS